VAEIAQFAVVLTTTLQVLIAVIASVSLVVGGNRHHEHHAGVGDGTNARDRHPHGGRATGGPTC